MQEGIAAFYADGRRQRFPNVLQTTPWAVSVNDVQQPFTIASTGEIDLGYIPAAGSVVKLHPKITITVYTLQDLPVTRDAVQRALGMMFDTAGGVSGTESWLKSIELYIAANDAESHDLEQVRYNAPLWPDTSPAWDYCIAILASKYGWSAPTQVARKTALQAQAVANRSA